jgi:hypothetical protein
MACLGFTIWLEELDDVAFISTKIDLFATDVIPVELEHGLGMLVLSASSKECTIWPRRLTTELFSHTVCAPLGCAGAFEVVHGIAHVESLDELLKDLF